MTHWTEIDTGKAQFHPLSDKVLLCRPKRGRAAAVLHLPPAELGSNELALVRHLIVRKRALAGYDARTVAAVAADDKLMDSIVEFPKPSSKKRPPMKTVRRLMAERGLHGQLRPKESRAWIQVHMGRHHRVWDHGVGPIEGLSFDTREEAIIARDRINTGATGKRLPG